MKRRLTIFITLIAFAVFVGTIVHATLYAPTNSTYAPPAPAAAVLTQATTTPGELPARLIIPTLHINAKVQNVGLTAAGNMGVPNNFTDVAWYKYGVVPGKWGSAVIDGHVDNALSLAGVFKHLNEIKVGDDVYVSTVGGAMKHFIVRDVESYPYKDVPTKAIFNKQDAAHLNLITCSGSWVQSGRTYDQRLVVYTTLAPGQ